MRTLDYIPDRDTLAEILGLTRQSHAVTDVFPAVGIFAAGVMLGAALGLLFAPRSGEELREELSGRVGELRDHMSRAGRDASSMAET